MANRAIETSQLKREVRELKVRAGDTQKIIGQSTVISQLRQQLERVAPTNARVLISGSAGTGKELTARTIHGLSARSNGPFVVLSAATITPETMEEHLFGVEPAEKRPLRIGALEEAHGGSLYLDEVGDMPRDTQSKILRVLVDQNFQRVGGGTRVSVDVRLISSTKTTLPKIGPGISSNSPLFCR